MDDLKKVLLSENEYTPDGQRLIGNGCRDCGNHFFPKREFCPSCLNTETIEDFIIPEIGTLYSYTEIHVALKKFQPPYTVGYVDIDDQLRIFGHIHLPDGANPIIGQTMNVKLDSIGEEDGKTLIGVVLVPINEE